MKLLGTQVSSLAARVNNDAPRMSLQHHDIIAVQTAITT